MADVQLENGYTRIANELLEAVLKTPFVATHLKIILTCWRYTYGFGRKETELSLNFISKATSISKRYISDGLTELINSNVLIVVKDSTYSSSRIIAFNKNYTEWMYRTTVPQVNRSSTGDVEVDTTVEPQFNTTVEPQFHQERKNKKNLNLGDYEKFFEEVWRLYPKKEGKGAVRKTQKKKLYSIGFEQMKRCIDRYKAAKVGTDRKYLQMGSTFFNSGYVDYLDSNVESPQEDTLQKPSDFTPDEIEFIENMRL